jgi:ABC-type xylose transport system permease subunit
MKSSTSGIFEVVWFVLGGLMLFMAVDVTASRGIADSWFYFLLSVLAFMMYFLRRRMRINRRQY